MGGHSKKCDVFGGQEENVSSKENSPPPPPRDFINERSLSHFIEKVESGEKNRNDCMNMLNVPINLQFQTLILKTLEGYALINTRYPFLEYKVITLH